MNNEQKRERKRKAMQRKFDHDRALRIVEHNGNPSILGESPIEPIEEYIYADRDECAVFLSFVFKNLSEKALVGLDIRIDFYYYQNIPYFSLCFSYCKNDLSFGIISIGDKKLNFRQSCLRDHIESGECFGEKTLIPITEIAYTKIKTVLVSAEFEDGSKVPIDLAVNGRAKRINELDRASRSIFEHGDVSPHLKKRFPAKNIPQFGDSAWLCCCGNKNPARFEKCSACHRDKTSQEKLLSESAISEQKEKLIADPTAITFHDKSKYSQNKHLENKQDIKKKSEMAKRAMENVIEEQNKRGAFGLVIRFAVWAHTLGIAVAIMAIAVILYFALEDPGKDSENFTKFIQKLLDGDF